MKRSRRRTAGRLLLAVALLLVAATAGWWAARSTLTGSVAEPPPEPTPVTAAVAETTVGRTLELSVTVEQPQRVLAVNLLPGVVTGVNRLDAPVGVGTTLYSVAGVPVRAVQGDVPFYRGLEQGTRGTDVRQLQAALRSMGYQTREPTGFFDRATTSAVTAWQGDLAQPESGRITLGELVAVNALPIELRLGEDLQVGALMSTGEDAVLASTGARVFTIVLDRVQARAVPADASVEVTWQASTWPAVIASTSVDDEGFTVLRLSGAEGTAVCADACATLPPDPQLTLPARVVIEPPVTGPGVPAAAIRTTADGRSYVVMDDGTERDVEVLGSSRGVAVVDGVVAGDTVRLPEGG